VIVNNNTFSTASEKSIEVSDKHVFNLQETETIIYALLTV